MGLAKRLLNLPLKPFGLEIIRRGDWMNHAPTSAAPVGPTSSNRLPHIAGLGFSPRVIFDCGAYTGNWAVGMSKLFPGAQLILIEPNTRMHAVIRKNTAAIQPLPVLVEAAVGPAEGTAELNVWNNEDDTPSAGSSLLSHVQGEASTRVKTRVMQIDTIAAEQGKSPDFLKLDLQGFEFPALQGATKVLQTAELCEIEFGVLEAYNNRTTPRQIIDLMYDNNYTLYDLVDLLYRPYDGALTGGDFIFVKNDSPLRKYKGYK